MQIIIIEKKIIIAILQLRSKKHDSCKNEFHDFFYILQVHKYLQYLKTDLLEKHLMQICNIAHG